MHKITVGNHKLQIMVSLIDCLQKFLGLSGSELKYLRCDVSMKSVEGISTVQSSAHAHVEA